MTDTDKILNLLDASDARAKPASGMLSDRLRAILPIIADLPRCTAALRVLVEALNGVLSAAKPHPSHHPAMWKAWSSGNDALASVRAILEGGEQ